MQLIVPLASIGMGRLADEASMKMDVGPDPGPTLVLSTTPEAQALKVNEVLLAELEIMLEDNLGALTSNDRAAQNVSRLVEA